jgi:hypothetical protein
MILILLVFEGKAFRWRGKGIDGGVDPGLEGGVKTI